MKCSDCRLGEMNETFESVRYVESGLPNLVLKNISVIKCQECDHKLLSIPDLELLQRCICVRLLNRAERLTRAEISFLRKSLGWSKADCARKLHVWPEQVSRWESAVSPVPMQVQSELLLRTLVALAYRVDGLQDYIEDIATIAAEPLQLFTMRYENKGWELID